MLGILLWMMLSHSLTKCSYIEVTTMPPVTDMMCEVGDTGQMVVFHLHSEPVRPYWPSVEDN